MIHLFFGNVTSTATTILLICAVLYITYTAVNHKHIKQWGRNVAALFIWGLLICCLAAMRDSYHLSVQASFDSTIRAGIFTIDSIQSSLCCIGGAVIAFSGISSIFIKNQKYRKIMFFLMSLSIILKMLIIECSRLL